MTRAQATRLSALLIEVRNLADSAKLCTDHTFYESKNADALKKYKRTDQDVREWLERLDAAVARLGVVRLEVSSLHPAGALRR